MELKAIQIHFTSYLFDAEQNTLTIQGAITANDGVEMTLVLVIYPGAPSLLTLRCDRTVIHHLDGEAAQPCEEPDELLRLLRENIQLVHHLTLYQLHYTKQPFDMNRFD